MLWHSALIFSLPRWPLSLRSTERRWSSYWLWELQTSPSFFLPKTVVHLAFVFAKRLLRVPWCSVSSVEKFTTVAALRHRWTSSMAKPGFARFASARGNPLWIKFCLCWPHCRGSGSGCQKETPCASSLRGRCAGSIEFSRPALTECWRVCQRWPMEKYVITPQVMLGMSTGKLLLVLIVNYYFREEFGPGYLHNWLRKQSHLFIQSTCLFLSRVSV